MRPGFGLWLGIMALSGVASARADVTVDTVDEKVVIHAEASRVAAWKATRDGLALLAEGNGDVQITKLPSGWQGDVIEQNGMHGVFLRAKAGASTWTAMQENGKWLVREGTPQQKQMSALLLRDGWRVDGVRVPVHEVDVAGETWQVGGVGNALSVAGSVVGVVRKGTMTADEKTAQARASVEASPAVVKGSTPAAVSLTATAPQPGMKPASVNQMLSRLEPASAKVGQMRIAAPSGVVNAAMVTGKDSKVKFHTAQGLAAVAQPNTLSEEMTIEPAAGPVKGIYVPGTLVSVTIPLDVLERKDSSASEPVATEVSASVPQALVHTMFPTVEGNYYDGYAERMQALTEALSSKAEQEARMALAAYFIAWERPEEAAATLSMLPKRKDGLPADPMARLYLGVAQLAMNRQPPQGVFDQEGGLEGHARLWRAVTLAQNEDYGEAMKAWPRERGILPEYPVYIRQLAQEAQATCLVMVGDKQVASKVLDELVAQYDAKEVPTALMRLQGLVRLGTADERRGLEYLARAAESTTDLSHAYRAKFEFVQSLRQHKDLSDDQSRKYLEELWLDWRGDKLERDVLSELADLYEKAGEPREALERWQALVRAFPNIPDLNVITERMTQAFVDVFDPENPKTYDPLTYLGIYYDFRELVPNDDRGDRVQEQVAKLLTDSTLWTRAVPILEKQLNYRKLDPVDQARLALMLAEAYRRQGKAADGLKLLDKWEKVANTSTSLARGWKLAQARCLMDLSRFDSARRTVDSLKDDREAVALRVEADWKMQDWNKVVADIQQQLGGVAPTALVSDTGAQLGVFQLAYAYGQLRDDKGLKALKERYADGLNKLPELADGVNAVAAGTGMASAEGGGVLAPLTGTLAALNGLTDQIEELRHKMNKVREERKDYNEKMRYMELLPPPVI